MELAVEYFVLLRGIRPMMNCQADELPLSWSWSEKTLFHSVKLQTGKSFVYCCDLASDLDIESLSQELHLQFPEGFLVKGCSKEFGELLFPNDRTSLVLAYSALLDLEAFHPPKKVRNLIRRVEEQVYCEELALSPDNLSKLQNFHEEVHANAPVQVRYFFRDTFEETQRVFVVRFVGQEEILAALSLTLYGEGAWHTELLCRHPDAPNGAMEFLIAKTSEVLASEGAKKLNLGEVPAIFPEQDGMTVAWDSFSARERSVARRITPIHELVSSFYDIEGLYRFKRKFKPTWEPRRYFASPDLKLKDLLALSQVCVQRM